MIKPWQTYLNDEWAAFEYRLPNDYLAVWKLLHQSRHQLRVVFLEVNQIHLQEFIYNYEAVLIDYLWF